MENWNDCLTLKRTICTIYGSMIWSFFTVCSTRVCSFWTLLAWTSNSQFGFLLLICLLLLLFCSFSPPVLGFHSFFSLGSLVWSWFDVPAWASGRASMQELWGLQSVWGYSEC